jgi:hypothetical protein
MPSVVLLPKKPLVDAAKLRQAITNTLTAQAKAIKADFDVTTQTWRNRPDFKIESPSDFVREISTDDDVYAILNEGSPRHPISARNKPFLVFRWGGFRSKTIPGQIRSRQGAPGKQWAKKVSVEHPGSAARYWNKVIAQKWGAQLPTTFQRAIDAAVS